MDFKFCLQILKLIFIVYNKKQQETNNDFFLFLVEKKVIYFNSFFFVSIIRFLILSHVLINNNNDDVSTDEFVRRLQEVMRKAQPTPTRVISSEKYLVPKKLKTCSHVWIKNESRIGLEPPYKGPFKVISRNENTITVDTPNGRDEVVLHRCKPAVVEKSVSFDDFLPRRRGRPRKSQQK